VRLRQQLDELYAAFCETLPPDLRACAYELPYRLQLAAVASTPWSQVFGHDVTFAAPALFAEAMPHISRAKVRDAVLAHTLAVIDGFGTDRIEDRQIARSVDLEELLTRIRAARDRALVRVSNRDDAAQSFARAHHDMLDSIRAEQRIFADHESVDFEMYERIAVGKSAIGVPASVALARAAGWMEAECQAVAKTLTSVWLGMQYHDDVLDWEDDHRRNSAWAVLLARGAPAGADAGERPTQERPIQDMVLGSGILAHMLERSFRHFRAAGKRAEALGARELAAWAKTKEDHAKMLARHERGNSGYAVRLHALSPWAEQILS
jgi:hypothetical protein